jgi:putative transposase
VQPISETITCRTLHVFFVIHHASRQVLHVHVTAHPTAAWTAQQIVECCAWVASRHAFSFTTAIAVMPPASIGECVISQARTLFRSPRANAIAERCVRSVRTEWIFNERHLQKVLATHRSIGQHALCAPVPFAPHRRAQAGGIVAMPVLGGLHHVYERAA